MRLLSAAEIPALLPMKQVIALMRDAFRIISENSAQVAEHRGRTRASLVAVADPVTALEWADIVISATNSSSPVVPGALIQPGCHVGGIGSFKKGMCEFDDELISKASIYVENRLTAETEAGELMHATALGKTAAADWTEIGEVLNGKRPGRSHQQEITFFKSVGHAVFDLVAARAAWQSAVERDIGMEWSP